MMIEQENQLDADTADRPGIDGSRGDVASALIQRERIRGASRVIQEGTDAAKITAEQIAAVASDVALFAKAHKIKFNEIARALGYSHGVISEFISGKYDGNCAKVAMDVEAWLVDEERRRTQSATTQFTWTNVAMEIKAVASYCLENRKIGLVYGPDSSGIGKTTALRAVHQELGPRRCSFVTIDKVDAHPSGLLRKIAAAIGKTDSGSNRKFFERICGVLQDRNHLLIIDQIHSLRGSKDDKPFYILADLYERTHVAQLWCGTSDLAAYLNRQIVKNCDESLAQLRSRIFPYIDLMACLRRDGGGGEPLVTIDQVREMFGRNRMRLAGQAARFLYEICNLPDSGSVRLCVQIVEYATMLADLRGVGVIDLPLLKEALRRGFSPQRAEVLMRKIEIEPLATRAAEAG